MIYFSKRVKTLVNGIALKKQKENEEQERVELGFIIDASEAQKEVESIGGLVPKSMVKKGNNYAYIVAGCIERMTACEERKAEISKANVIETLASSEDEIGIGLFGKAREIASLELAKTMSKERADYISYLVAHDTVGYGPISMLLEDRKSIEEIEVNAPCAPINIFHVSYGRCATNLRFKSADHFRHSINKLIYDADKELGEETPIIDAQVENARIHAQIKPYAISGAVASIRLTDSRVVGADYLVKRGTTNPEVLAYLWMAMDARKNIVIAGSPASGKTTLMSALFSFVPRIEKVVTIEEDINELKVKIDINNSVALYGSRYGGTTSTREQVINALRMRPDRLVIGEVRGEETRELFSGANLGVPFMTTMHSSTGGMEIVKKLMIKPMCVEARALSMLDLAVYMKHVDLSKRLLSEVYEYKWLSRAESERMGMEIEESDSVETVNIVSNCTLARELLADSKVIAAFSERARLTKKQTIKELDRRAEFLRVLSEGCKNTNEMLEKIQGYGW